MSGRRGSSSPAVGRFGEIDSTRLPGRVTAAVCLSALVLAIAVSAGATVLAVVLGASAVLLAAGWPVLAMTGRPGIQRWLLAATGLALAVTAAATAGSHRLVWLPVVVAIGMIGGFFVHLLSPAGREGLAEGMSGLLGGMAVLASGACLIPLALADRGPRYVLVAMAAVVAGAVVEPLGRERWAARWIVLLVMLAGAVVGFLVTMEVGGSLMGGLGLGLLLASLSLGARRTFGAQPGTRTGIGQVAVGVASVLLVGVVVLAMATLAGIAPA